MAKEYQQVTAATEWPLTHEERDIEARQAEVDTAQALLARRSTSPQPSR